VKVGVPESDQPWWEAKDLKPIKHPGKKKIKVEL
jgi:hypothetical protein